MENYYQGNVNEHMKADYCWFLQKESDTQHNRKLKRQRDKIFYFLMKMVC